MKALIIQEPWISLILEGRKTWELRLRATKVRGRIGLIRSKSGLVLGTAELVDCHEMSHTALLRRRDLHQCSARQLRAYSDGRQLYAWELRNAKAYRRPKRYAHPSGAVIWVNL